MITYRPLPGRSFDDTAIRDRLDVVERNRSVGEPVVAEIVSIVDIDETRRFQDLGVFGFDAQFSDGVSTTNISAIEFDRVVETFTAAVAGTKLTATLRAGRLVVTSSTGSLSVTTASAYDFERIFPRPIPGYGVPILARPGVVYDTDATHVRAPESGLSPGSGESMETALRALHAADRSYASPINPVVRIAIPRTVTKVPWEITVEDLGLKDRRIGLHSGSMLNDFPAISSQEIFLSDGTARIQNLLGSFVFDDGVGVSVGTESDPFGRRFFTLTLVSQDPRYASADAYLSISGAPESVVPNPFVSGADTLFSADQIRTVGGRHTIESYLSILADEIRSLRVRVAALEVRP